jgi:DNA mismatch repair protein MutS2
MRATRPEIVSLDEASGGAADVRSTADRGRPTAGETSRDGRSAAASPVIRLVDARHPLLSGHVVPLSMELGGTYDVVVITGPNTGGKTVALKTVGLLALMAQAGLQVPAAEGSRLAVFESVVADIGDEQSIEQSLSTFSAHVTNIVGMLGHAGPRSLVLLDELGAGTDPLEGSALARALVQHLLERGAYCVATTHYPELKAFAAATPRVENASVEFDLETLSPTYRLQVGLPGQSNALEIATRLGMPADVVEAARGFLNPRHGELEGLLEEIRRERDEAEAERARAAGLAEDQEKLRRRLRQALADAERQRAEAWQRAQEESEALLQELRREVERVRRELGAAAARREEMASAVALAEQLVPIQAPPGLRAEEMIEPELLGPARLDVGQEVLVPGLGVPATILSLNDQQAELEVHGRRVLLPRARLAEATPASRAQRKAEAAAHERMMASSFEREVPVQLDLRGKRRDEAIPELESYLHDAYMAGLGEVRVVHGRGTGAIRQAVREVLAGHPLVSGFGLADRHEGGEGATVVTLSEH